jgi:hypothetical protein
VLSSISLLQSPPGQEPWYSGMHVSRTSRLLVMPTRHVIVVGHQFCLPNLSNAHGHYWL